MKSVNYKKITIAVIAIAILLRIILTSLHTISGDACWHFSASKFIANNHYIPFDETIGRSKFEPFWPSPLFHIVVAFFYSMLGEFGLKLTPLIFGSLSIIFSYLIFKKFLNERAVFYATLFVSFIPIGINYSVLGYPESIVSFFIILSIYFAVDEKFLASGISAGFAILSKFTGVFVIPVLLYLVYKKYKNDKKSLLKNFFFAAIVPNIVSLPWFIRNWILLGNPIWPFLNFIFHGLQAESYSNFGLVNLVKPSTYIITYLGFFGLPDGQYTAFFFYNLPYIWFLISIFFIGTLIYILPIFFGFKKNKEFNFVYVMLASFAILLMLFELNVRPAVSRIVLPAMFALGFVYGIGIDRIFSKKALYGKILTVSIIMIIAGFAVSEVIRFKIASDTWKFYKEDFEWVKKNTGKDDIFLNGGQCIQFRMQRGALLPSEDINSDKYKYIWINQGFKLEPQSIMTNEELSKVYKKNIEKLYDNKKTGTAIYKIIR